MKFDIMLLSFELGLIPDYARAAESLGADGFWLAETQADFLCLLARTSDEKGFRGLSLFVVPTDRPGYSVSRKLDKLGHRSSDTAILAFDDVRVPAANRIGPEGMGYVEEYPMARYFRDARLMSIGGGADEIMLGIIAKYEDILPRRKK